jgi:hypothetical protein
MNFYFVFEGKTEPIVYKSWLSVLLPHLTEVDGFDKVRQNNYHYESDMGVPDCYNVVANAVQEINEHPQYDYLVLIIDADRSTVEEKIEEAYAKINEKLLDKSKKHTYKSLPHNCKLEIIVQKVCIETWFLGNQKFFVRHPQNELLKQYVDYFDVSINNPEDLANEFIQEKGHYIFGYSTKALFHEGYLREIFKEHNLHRTSRTTPPSEHLSYNKRRPIEVHKPHYLEQLQLRVDKKPYQLLSFQNLLNFCQKIRNLDIISKL